MGGERVIPPACVEALHGLMPAGVRETAARAVLDAFVAGEGSGPNKGWWLLTRRNGETFLYPKREQATAVAAVLNYLEAKGE